MAASTNKSLLKQSIALATAEKVGTHGVTSTDYDSALNIRELKKVAALAGPQFKLGIVLYDGTETLPLGDGLWAAPLSSLWGD